MATKTYLALGDSMSIDLYTGVTGGGAVAQLHRSLGRDWALTDFTQDGCVIDAVPRAHHGELITLTIGGNDLYQGQMRWLQEGLRAFDAAHRSLLGDLRGNNPQARLIVGNVYAPQFELDAARLALLDEANAMIATNTSAVGAQLADLRAAFRGHEATWLCRLIEPSLEGATAIAALFREGARGAT